MFRRVPHRLRGALIGAGLGLPLPAFADCIVDSIDSVVHERRQLRVDRLRMYVDSGSPSCAWTSLTHPGSGDVTAAKARVIRGDTRNAKFGTENLFWTEQNGDLGASYYLPGLRTGDIVVLQVERRISEDHQWLPDAWGSPGWARLRWRGAAEPSESTVPRNGSEFWIEREQLEAAGGGLFVRYGLPQPSQPPTDHSGQASVTITLQPEANPPPGEPPLGTTRVEWRVPVDPQGRRAIAWPQDATDRICQIEGAPEALVRPSDPGCAVAEATEGAVLYVAWTAPRLQLAGEIGPARRAAMPGSPWFGHADKGPLPQQGTLAGVGAVELRVQGSGVSFRGQVRSGDRLSSQAGEGSLSLLVPGTAYTDASGIPPHGGWWVTAVHGQPLLANRAAVVSAVARSAIRASVPEPGLPARIRLRSGEVEMVPEVFDLVRSQVRPSAAPGIRSLQPRKLPKVRASTYGTEWEVALITARYLQQLKLNALPIPVRSSHVAASDPGMPAGFDHAVVRVALPPENPYGVAHLWLDPACAVCAIGELRPQLWGADALAESLTQLPDPPEGRQTMVVRLRSDGSESLTVDLRGTAALALRLDLLQLPADRRLVALDERFGGRVTAHAGLADPGEPIHLELTRSGVLDPSLPASRIPVPDAPHIRVPWVGERIHELRIPPGLADVSLAPAGSAAVAGADLSWRRTLSVEADGTRVARDVLTLGRLIASRDGLRAIVDQVPSIASERLTAPDGEAPPLSVPVPSDDADP